MSIPNPHHVSRVAEKVQLRELVKKLIPESIGKEIEKQTQAIFPLKDCSLARRFRAPIFVWRKQ